MKHAAFQLFMFPGRQMTEQAQETENALRPFHGSIVVETILLTPNTTVLYETFGVQNGGCYLIRPDLYIAYRSTPLNVELLQGYLKRFLIPSALSETVLT